MKQFEVSRRALRDLREICEFISEDSFDAADRVLEDFYHAFGRLAETPGMGHSREDLTHRNVLFWRVHSHLLVYTASKPLRIVRVVHGKRHAKTLLVREHELLGQHLRSNGASLVTRRHELQWPAPRPSSASMHCRCHEP